MGIVWGRKDGGPESKVSMYGIEFKRLFSVLLLRFEKGSRDAFHSHAFNSVSLVLTGGLQEWIHVQIDEKRAGAGEYNWTAGDVVKTYRDTVHQVHGINPTNWVLSLRGPWVKNWYELRGNTRVDLEIGRAVKEVKQFHDELRKQAEKYL